MSRLNRFTLFSMTLSIVIATLLALPTGTQAKAESTQDTAAESEQKTVLVTGASSGIGRKITELLAAEGHHVYAGARKQADMDALNALENVQAVRLDVTQQEEIDAAVAWVQEQGRGLHGVVNNAGVAVFSPMNQTPEEDIEFVFDVNIFGPYRINRAFTPLLVESGGRTTTIGSISGYLAGPQSGTYSMSKFAMEAYTDALSAELAADGVHVSIVEPGGYKSRIREKVARHAMQRMEDGNVSLSDEERARLEQVISENEQLKEPDEVAQAVLHALFDANPKRRYMVTPNENQAEITIRTALGKVVQLNQDQPYSYSREELIEMLDALMADED